MKKFYKGTVPDLPYKKAIKKPIPVEVFQVNEPFVVETLEGPMQGQAGDWLAIGIHGEMWLIAKDIFPKTYDLI